MKTNPYLYFMNTNTKHEIVSIYTVTEMATGEQYEESPIGDGQKAITQLRKKYPRFTKFVLEGFEINGKFTPLQVRNRY